MEGVVYMEEIVGKLRSFFASGETLPLAWRKTQLEALRDMLTRESKALEAVLHEDLGKPSHESWLTEIGFMQHEISHVLKHLSNWMKPRRVPTPFFLSPAKSRLCPIPRGLALVISPWNYPLQLTLSPLVASLAAGNVTLLKPSEYAPATSRWLHDNLPRCLDARGVAVIEGA
ncbi:MAG: aldehyde dehydrogenase family protein, partial [Proteobacteria bacterium]|nr:aldehyde dehydrogenase family protein [Pseudomonadota bacterium]